MPKFPADMSKVRAVATRNKAERTARFDQELRQLVEFFRALEKTQHVYQTLDASHRRPLDRVTAIMCARGR